MMIVGRYVQYILGSTSQLTFLVVLFHGLSLYPSSGEIQKTT